MFKNSVVEEEKDKVLSLLALASLLQMGFFCSSQHLLGHKVIATVFHEGNLFSFRSAESV
jgi:hypothetical protein